MDTNVKNMVGIVLALALIAIAYATLQTSHSYARSQSQGSFTVTGEGKIIAVPDIAQLSASVITEADNTDLPALQKDNNEKINQVTEFVKNQGVLVEDIKTSSYNINPRYSYANCLPGRSCPPPTISGYAINSALTIKVRDLEKAGEILSGVVQNGANSVTGPNFTVAEPENVKQEARTKAIANAQAKATALAQAAGFRVGKILLIAESGGQEPPALFAERAAGFGGGSDASVLSLEPGSQEVIANVSMTYEIK